MFRIRIKTRLRLNEINEINIRIIKEETQEVLDSIDINQLCDRLEGRESDLRPSK
jgi:hypothetical protein